MLVALMMMVVVGGDVKVAMVTVALGSVGDCDDGGSTRG